MKVEVSAGELLDKITILEIKKERMSDPEKLKNVRHEHDVLSKVQAEELPDSPELRALVDGLREVNGRLWTIEDDIRDCERAGDFGETFVALARSVYRVNDERAKLKREINVLLGSDLVEEKSYQAY